MGGTRPSVFETPRTGDHGSGEGGFEGLFFAASSGSRRVVVDAAGEASRFVERFAGDVSSARTASTLSSLDADMSFGVDIERAKTMVEKLGLTLPEINMADYD